MKSTNSMQTSTSRFRISTIQIQQYQVGMQVIREPPKILVQLLCNFSTKREIIHEETSHPCVFHQMIHYFKRAVSITSMINNSRSYEIHPLNVTHFMVYYRIATKNLIEHIEHLRIVEIRMARLSSKQISLYLFDCHFKLFFISSSKFISPFCLLYHFQPLVRPIASWVTFAAAIRRFTTTTKQFRSKVGKGIAVFQFQLILVLLTNRASKIRIFQIQKYINFRQFFAFQRIFRPFSLVRFKIVTALLLCTHTLRKIISLKTLIRLTQDRI